MHQLHTLAFISKTAAVILKVRRIGIQPIFSSDYLYPEYQSGGLSTDSSLERIRTVDLRAYEAGELTTALRGKIFVSLNEESNPRHPSYKEGVLSLNYTGLFQIT